MLKYRRDQLILQINEVNLSESYDSNVSNLLLQDLIDEFNDVHIQEYLDNDQFVQELLVVNPD